MKEKQTNSASEISQQDSELTAVADTAVLLWKGTAMLVRLEREGSGKRRKEGKGGGREEYERKEM